MLPLNQLDALFEEEGAVKIEEMREIIQTNSRDGQVLLTAAKEGYLNVVNFILNAKNVLSLSCEEEKMCSNAGCKDEDENSPLHLAAANGHIRVVECLLSSPGTLVNVENQYEETPLTLACREGCDNVVSMLIKYGARPARSDSVPMEMAALSGHIDNVKCLLEVGAPIGCAMKYAAFSNEEIVRLLSEHFTQEDRYCASSMLSSALCEAIQRGHNRICEMLLDIKVDSRSRDDERLRPLYLAAEKGDTEILQLLISKGAHMNFDVHQTTLLHEASKLGHVNVVEFLLNLNMNVNHVNEQNETPLDIALERGHTKIVILLHSYGAVSKTKEYYLKLASKQCRFLSMCSLFSMGANPSEQDAGEMLRYACCENAIDIARLLVKKSPCVNALHGAHGSPLHIACRQKCGERLVEFLLKSHADPHLINENGSTALHVVRNKESARLLLQRNVLVDARDKRYRTPLYDACFNSCWDVAELLIKYGASVNTRRDRRGDILLLCVERVLEERFDRKCYYLGYCVKNCRCGLGLIFLKSVEIMQLLLENGAQVNRGTPLHIAVTSNALEVVKLLLTYGADVNAVKMEGATALHLCESAEVAELLLKSGADPMCQDLHGDTPLCAARRCKINEVAAFLEKYLSQYTLKTE